MSSTFLSGNDLNRLDRERMLTVQAPRVPIENERVPTEYRQEDSEYKKEDSMDWFFDAMFKALERRSQ